MANRSISFTALALMLLTFAAASAAPAAPAPACLEAVTRAITRAFPKSAVTACKPEREHGHDQFEVKLVKPDGGKLEVDVSPDGKILQTEEKIAVDKLPAAVTKAFAARYPKAKVDAAEKQTPSDGAVVYELACAVNGARKEVTFTEAGAFVGEE